MSKALPVNLRERVVAAIDEGTSCRAAATRFWVSVASANRCRALEQLQSAWADHRMVVRGSSIWWLLDRRRIALKIGRPTQTSTAGLTS